MIQAHLKSITFEKDFIPELPVEIIVLVAPYLELSDLLVVRRVSRGWLAMWTSVPVCNKLMKDYFRSNFENEYCRLLSDNKPAVFMAAADRLHAMQSGKYHTMRILRYDHRKQDATEASDDSQPILDRQYCAGKVAWAIKGGIQVTTLKNGTTNIFLTPNRESATSWVLSEEVLVAATDVGK